MEIIKRFARYTLLAGMLLAGGCMNIMYHTGTPIAVYKPTREASKAFVEIFCPMPEWHYGSGSEAAISHAYAVFLSPYIIVDLPLEAVADTITFPYDWYCADRYQKAQEQKKGKHSRFGAEA